ncbi:ABC transporter substrate-binding protein [Actinorhabdospora filicis]|uniref:ABC transporter substrate-binding protein n=1 Tax=Actinorhabdospora filicis TaxID=1785913 RepID=UPI00255212BE|nr:ABC transporter substrate-binding protein [Actinorhabdospora filicis]
MTRLVYSGLYTYNNDGSLKPVIAEGQPTSTDNKVWTIKLKSGWTFQNGEAIDANTFKKAWDYTVYGPNANSGSYFFNKITGFADTQSGADPDGDGPQKGAEPKAKELSGVKVVDPTTIQITLDTPWVVFPALLGYTAFYPTADACRAQIEACNEAPIGNGPFKFVGKWEHKTSIKLEKWSDYKGEQPSYQKLNFTIFTGSNNSQWAPFEAGSLDIAAPTPDKYESAKQKYGDRMIEADSPSTWSLGFPSYDNIYKDPKVRQAFSLAVDRQGIIDAIFTGRGKPLATFIPTMIPGYTEGTCATYCKTDPAAAKALLDSSTWPKGKKVELWINSGGTGEKILKAIGDQLAKNLGVEYEMKNIEWNDFLQKKQDHKLTGPFFTGWQPDYADSENYMGPLYYSGAKDGSDNDFGYYNADFQKLMDEGNAAPTIAEAHAKYTAAEKILTETLPVAPLYTGRTSTVIGDKIDFKSVDRNPILGGIDFVKIKLK